MLLCDSLFSMRSHRLESLNWVRFSSFCLVFDIYEENFLH